jgi:hypothetical protein
MSVSLCVHKLWAKWVRRLFTNGLLQVELASSKGFERARSFFGSLRSSSFFPTRFLLVPRQSASPLPNGIILSRPSFPNQQGSCTHHSPRRQQNVTRHSLRHLRNAAIESMIPLVPTLVLSFLSFFCSVFVILRTVIPILPPHPLSRRVAPVRCYFLLPGAVTIHSVLTEGVHSPNLVFRTSRSWCQLKRLISGSLLAIFSPSSVSSGRSSPSPSVVPPTRPPHMTLFQLSGFASLAP